MTESKIMAALYATLREQHGVTWMNHEVEYEPNGVNHGIRVYGVGSNKISLYGYGSTVSAALRKALCIDPLTGEDRSLGPDIDALIARLEALEGEQ